MQQPTVHRTTICALVCIASACAAAAPELRPYQLQVNYQRQPSLGVGKKLRFSWAVPPAKAGAVHTGVHVQATYRIVITAPDSGGKVVWDSGTVHSSASINVELEDASASGLLPGSYYEWTVACDSGPPSTPAAFVTALWAGFDPDARWVWARDTNRSQHYAHFRHALGGNEIFAASATSDAPNANHKRIQRALLFVTAWQEPTMLASYKFYVDDRLVSLGPGRGEADVLSHNSTLVHAPYATVDITQFVHPRSVLAVEGMAPLFQAPCLLHACTDYNTAGGGVLAQLVLTYADGTTTRVTTGGSVWTAIARDDYYNPSPPAVHVAGLDSETAYAKVLEHLDAAEEVVGWRTAPSVSPPWPAAVQSAYQDRGALIAKMARPLQVFDVPAPTVVRNASAPSSFFVDFGREFQGGIVISVHGSEEGAGGGAVAGTTVRLTSGELLLPNGATDATTGSRIAAANTWGYQMNWTLRSGPQVLRQHDYMIFRYLAIEWSGSVPALNFSVGAWGVKYEYVDGDSSFASDNATLDAVYELARWTLDGGVVDTYTDSNSRERRPYECDGLVAATNRALVQNDAMWARHSHAWVLEVPTWPIEWQQMSALLAWHDYQATGSTDVFETYVEESCVTQHHITPRIHPLYTFIAAYSPMYTRYTCIYTIIHLTHL